MKKIMFIALFLLGGCATPQPPAAPTGEYHWSYKDPNHKHSNAEQLQDNFDQAQANCKIEALKVPNTTASCVRGQSLEEKCGGLMGFARGMCEGSYRRHSDCDYSVTNQTMMDKSEIYNSCMITKHWRRVWKPYATAGN